MCVGRDIDFQSWQQFLAREYSGLEILCSHSTISFYQCHKTSFFPLVYFAVSMNAKCPRPSCICAHLMPLPIWYPYLPSIHVSQCQCLWIYIRNKNGRINVMTRCLPTLCRTLSKQIAVPKLEPRCLNISLHSSFLGKHIPSSFAWLVFKVTLRTHKISYSVPILSNLKNQSWLFFF